MSQSSVDIPAGKTVSVKLLNLGHMRPSLVHLMMEPPIPGIEAFEKAASMAFLIEHASGRRFLFDLGLRKDWEGLSADARVWVKRGGLEISIPEHAIDILAKNGIEGADIEGIIWSHPHFDHTGNPALFPKSTALIAGPGFKENFVPETAPRASLIVPSDTAGRPVREISFDARPPSSSASSSKEEEEAEEKDLLLRIGAFRARDFFGDGSLYLLDAPGHMTGHMCALARTSTPHSSSPSSSSSSQEKAKGSSQDTFVLLAGDVAHHASCMRPSHTAPFPDAIRAQIGSAYAALQRSRGMDPRGPAYRTVLADDVPLAREVLADLQALDADERIWTIVAHDRFVSDAVGVPEGEMGAEGLNGWKEKGWREASRWTFLRELGFEVDL